ncbi:hypothetical protein [Burkholderia ubonensis]|uniref:hypothetical protein n=1 Tax=Burkholderia ubonensis TaxID=101571 RepID=UPI000A54F171|nr:hypothetical protein [Burkholderia ubonensis]
MAWTPPVLNCRGDDKRNELLGKYDFLPISRARIAEGVTVDGCCGELTDVQVIFLATEKSNPTHSWAVSMGDHCAQELRALMQATGAKHSNVPLPPLSNPFVSPPLTSGGGGGGGGTGQTVPKLNQELYDALNLWFSLQGKTPKFAMLNALVELRNNPYMEIKHTYVYDFFKVIASWKKSLADLVSAYKPTDPTRALKTPSFPTLNALAAKNWIDLP